MSNEHADHGNIYSCPRCNFKIIGSTTHSAAEDAITARWKRIVEGQQEKITALVLLVQEWICVDCETSYPGPPTPGFDCLMCPTCNGRTMPRNQARIAELERENERLKEKVVKLERVWSHAPSAVTGPALTSLDNEKLRLELSASALVTKEACDIIKTLQSALYLDPECVVQRDFADSTATAFLEQPSPAYFDRARDLEAVAKAAQRYKDLGPVAWQELLDALSDLDKE